MQTAGTPNRSAIRCWSPAGQPSSCSPKTTWAGGPPGAAITRARAATSSGAVRSCRALAASPVGELARNRRSRNSAVSGLSGGHQPVARSSSHLARQTASIPSTGRASSSWSRVCLCCAPGIAPGPLASRVREAKRSGALSTAARATSPPKEWPTRCGRPPSASTTASTSWPSAPIAYASAGSSRPVAVLGALVLPALVVRHDPPTGGGQRLQHGDEVLLAAREARDQQGQPALGPGRGQIQRGERAARRRDRWCGGCPVEGRGTAGCSLRAQ